MKLNEFIRRKRIEKDKRLEVFCFNLNVKIEEWADFEDNFVSIYAFDLTVEEICKELEIDISDCQENSDYSIITELYLNDITNCI